MATENLTSVDGEIRKCDFEVDVDSKSKSGRVSLSSTKAVAILIVFVAIVIMVGVISFYETKRACDRKHATLLNGNGRDNDNEAGNDNVQGDNGFPSSPKNDVATASSPIDDPGPWNGRLPTDVRPEVYDLHIKPFLNEDDVEGTNHTRFTFEGSVVIRIRCENPTNEIVLHGEDLDLHSITVVDADNGDENMLDSMSYEKRYSFLRITVSELLKPDRVYNVSVDYIGEIKEEWHGIYRSSYTDQRGEPSWMAVTQMEPSAARYALPCFDEPMMKAVFNVRITHRTNMTALSNGREINTIDQGDGWSMTSFEPSPIMSTYLLALAVGVFDYRENISANGVRLRTWGRPDAIETSLFALESASSLLTYFENYFGLPYQMSKMDLIAIPDYGHGGMENWGLVTFPEGGIYYDPEVDTRSHQESMLTVISHEMAHQWFGNLVTMKWWDDLWLNEGFGTYFGYLGADALHPQLNLLDTMVSVNNFQVLDTDAFPTSHPIKVPVTSPNEISEIFDDISYIKGSAVLRMLHAMVGDDVFRSGIQLYLRTHEYSNANSDDLWDALTQADRGHGNIDVWQIMDTWILQMGYPLINLTRKDQSTISATQQRFLARGLESNPSESPFGYVWSIYLTYTHNGSRDYENHASVWIKGQQEEEFNLTGGVSSNDWYLANIHQFGFFRVNYDPENWGQLINQLNDDHEAIPVLNRVQLLEDSLALARNGRLPFSTAFELTSYLRNEFNFAPWNAVLGHFIFLRDLLSGTALQGPFEKYLRDLTSRAYHQFGLIDTRKFLPNEEKTREIILPIACKVKNVNCSLHALDLFKEFRSSFNLSDPSSNVLEVNTMETLLCTAIREGSQAEWDYLWSLYTDPRSTHTQTKMWLSAMACTIRPWQILRLLEYPMESPKLRHQVGYILEKVSITPVGRTLAWDYLRRYWEALQNIYGRSYRWLSVIRTVTMDFNTQQQLDEVNAFVISRNLGFGISQVINAVAVTSVNIETFNSIYPEMKTWFEAYDRTH